VRQHITIFFLAVFIFLNFSLYPQAPVYNEGTSFKLKNGLQVILSPIDNIKAVCVLLYHQTGIRDDPPEIRGASYLYQNLMVLGTKNLDIYDRILYLKRNGGIGDRVVNYDYSIFYQVVPASHINNALYLESERISSLQLTSSNIRIEQNRVYTKNYHLTNSNVHVMASNKIKSMLFSGSIYETPVYGNLEEIRGFDLQAVKKRYDNFRNLSNIIMVISGKFDIAELKKSINKHFGILSFVPKPTRNFKKSETFLAARKEFVSENKLVNNLSESFILYGILGPAKFNFDHLYFDFIRCYLVDERISKLEEILNRQRNLNVFISYESIDHLEASALIIKIADKRRANLERARYFLVKKLDTLQKGTISSADVKMTKSLMEIDFMKKMSRLETRSAFLAESYQKTGNLNSEENYLKRIRKINAYDIIRIARKYLEKNNRVNLNVFPKSNQ
jgi:predicted Zn-dependent peptidase